MSINFDPSTHTVREVESQVSVLDSSGCFVMSGIDWKPSARQILMLSAFYQRVFAFDVLNHSGEESLRKCVTFLKERVSRACLNNWGEIRDVIQSRVSAGGRYLLQLLPSCDLDKLLPDKKFRQPHVEDELKRDDSMLDMVLQSYVEAFASDIGYSIELECSISVEDMPDKSISISAFSYAPFCLPLVISKSDSSEEVCVYDFALSRYLGLGLPKSCSLRPSLTGQRCWELSFVDYHTAGRFNR